MIISHRNRFVFVKTNKTTGSSFEILLSDILGPDDIATKLGEAEEKLRDHLSSRHTCNRLSVAKGYGNIQAMNKPCSLTRNARSIFPSASSVILSAGFSLHSGGKGQPLSGNIWNFPARRRTSTSPRLPQYFISSNSSSRAAATS